MNKIFMFHQTTIFSFKLIDEWPNWPGKWLNIFGERVQEKLIFQKYLKKKLKNQNIRC